MANSPVMTSLTAYVEQRRLPLIKEAVLKLRVLVYLTYRLILKLQLLLTYFQLMLNLEMV